MFNERPFPPRYSSFKPHLASETAEPDISGIVPKIITEVIQAELGIQHQLFGLFMELSKTPQLAIDSFSFWQAVVTHLDRMINDLTALLTHYADQATNPNHPLVKEKARLLTTQNYIKTVLAPTELDNFLEQIRSIF